MKLFLLKFCRHLGYWLLAVLGTACAGFGEDNTPVPAALTTYPFQFRPVLLWSVTMGGDADKDCPRLGPVIKGDRIFVANKSGHLASVTLKEGHKRWQVDLKRSLSSEPAVEDGVIAIASMKPQLIVLKADNGGILWQAPLPNQVLAQPAIGQGRVVVKTVDGKVLAFALKTGKALWSYDHGAPTLVLRPSSAPKIAVGKKVLVGFSDGTFSALNLDNGRLLWERTIAFPAGVAQTDQLVDIAVNPLFSRQMVYVLTYQGELAAMQLETGQTRWTRPFSSYSGWVLGQNLFISDSDGGLWALNPLTGQVLWHNQILQNRGLTAPVISGNSIVVGDKEGYLHWFSMIDGHPLARVLVHDGASITAALSVADPIVCVLTQQGKLLAWMRATMST